MTLSTRPSIYGLNLDENLKGSTKKADSFLLLYCNPILKQRQKATERIGKMRKKRRKEFVKYFDRGFVVLTKTSHYILGFSLYVRHVLDLSRITIALLTFSNPIRPLTYHLAFVDLSWYSSYVSHRLSKKSFWAWVLTPQIL